MSRPEITTPEALTDESVVELSLRPQRLAEFIGQHKVKESLRVWIDAALARREPLDHSLFFGPPGLGKTTLAELIARELGVNIRTTSGPALEKPGDLVQIVRRSADVMKVGVDDGGANEIAKRSRGTPRVANRLLRRIRDYAQVRADGYISRDVAHEGLQMLDVDEFGLDDMDARILKTIIEKFEGGPVGLSTVAVAVAEDANTIEEVYEPFLVQHGFLQRTPRGRVATPMAYRHFGYTPPPIVPAQESLF